ncbi:MAG TPA: xanthine dehydrogenase family protein subunit M [Candidatus Acidoferrales bacterium]|nr:xanthine dehydrogenase family protein subunit M [Candidatus Acidoferrales bacterium]
MIPAAFEYARASSVGEASSLLAHYGEDAKILAGGQSLIPVMRLRLAQPTAIVDINPIRELNYLVVENGRLRIGALVRHVELMSSPVVRQNLPILADVATEVGDNQVRNLGTIGGVIAHADSAGDYPTLALMLDAEIVTNQRRHRAQDFFQGLFTTPLATDEVVCEITFPVTSGPHKYIKFRRRRFDWAIVGVGAQQTVDGWRIALTNVGPTPVRATAVERALAAGESPAIAAELASEGLNPSSDIRATPDYKRHLARVLTQRAIEQAQP